MRKISKRDQAPESTNWRNNESAQKSSWSSWYYRRLIWKNQLIERTEQTFKVGKWLFWKLTWHL